PIVGLILGNRLASTLGHNANTIGGALLVLTGGYMLIMAMRSRGAPTSHTVPKTLHKLLATGLALSIDNLIIGFSLGTTNAPLAEAVGIIGVTSVALSLLGLELGGRLKSRVVGYSEELGGVMLILVGIGVAVRLL
ncbi:MAG TPA: manganese efflux pump, partial [Candidatus Saccharimonadales bacterium]|nr:manganese efflux pump [Candidatus Saccharimonadales bacterium]